MNEHIRIKTGGDIASELMHDLMRDWDEGFEKRFNAMREQKWVSLSWLKEQIEKKQKLILEDNRCYCPECGAVMGCYSHLCPKCNERVAIPLEINPDGSDSFNSALYWFKSLLEES